MGLNSLMEDLQKKLINDINNSQLPVGIIYYIAKDVFMQIETEYQRTLKEEKIKQDIETESKEEKEDSE